MESEVYFLKYAFPCSGIKVDRGDMSQKEYDKLLKASINMNKVDRKLLEKIYPPAIRRMKIVSSKIGKDVWDIDTIAQYFLIDHNKFINDREGGYKNAPESFCEYCKVYKAEIIGIKQVEDNQVFVVTFNNGKKRVVIGDYIKNPNIGMMVIIHHGYAVESLDDKDSIAFRYKDRIE